MQQNKKTSLPHKPPKLSKKAKKIQSGVYRHYHHGDLYEVMGVACHSHGEGEFVVYRQAFGDGTLLVRRVEIFMQDVIMNGIRMPRFERVEKIEKFDESKKRKKQELAS